MLLLYRYRLVSAVIVSRPEDVFIRSHLSVCVCGFPHKTADESTKWGDNLPAPASGGRVGLDTPIVVALGC